MMTKDLATGVGTNSFLPPGEKSTNHDVYAAAVTVCCLLTGTYLEGDQTSEGLLKLLFSWAFPNIQGIEAFAEELSFMMIPGLDGRLQCRHDEALKRIISLGDKLRGSSDDSADNGE